MHTACRQASDWLQQGGQIDDAEMLRTFNCGIGMVVCVPADAADAATALLADQSETVYHIGEIRAADSSAPTVRYA